ncbi:MULTISPECIES: AAA family ATPase [unclassified Empedobacter]|uniref:AAA family ATPase n=1 Tax=unclassified Empedobacter TaxID=2643773 RepID=UPI0025C5FAC7|nr:MULTISPECIES: AAA family ATPase [unclassified Empedobacter]
MDIDIKKRIDSIAHPEAIKVFFNFINKFIKDNSISEDDERFVLNVRNDYRKRFSVNLNSRLILYVKDGYEFGFMINQEDWSNFKNIPYLKKESFEKHDPNAFLVSFSFDNVIDNIDLFTKYWLKCCKEYLPSQEKSQYRKYNIKELYKIAIDDELLNEYLTIDIKNMTLKFCQIINELKVYLLGENNILNNFKISEVKNNSRWVWITDNQNGIGDTVAHYEIISRRNKIYTEIHFEGNQESKDNFYQNISSLAENIEWFTWQNSKSIRFNKVFSFDEENLIKKLADSLLYLEENIGDKVREIINTIHSQSTINKKLMEFPLNQILYGPPGTGKTYSLKRRFFDLFTVKEDSISRDQFLNELVKPLSWWQVITLVLMDIKNAKVTEINDHELIKIKESHSSSKTIVPTIWGQLQAHTINDCPNVNVEKRQNPLYFSKDENSNWTINSELVKELYPEIIEVFNSFKNFNPSPNKLINNYEFVTFHQSFTYEDFIEGIKPDLENEDSELKYKIEDGIFKRVADRAKRDPFNKYALFIDEINRGNVSQIFGELITLIEEDKRLGNDEAIEVTLPYSKEKFGVPSNLYIIGTMNTADRSVEALDTPLRRRFVFEEMPPKYGLEGLQQDLFGFTASHLLETINKRIEKLLDKDHQIGHAYFINKNETTIIDSFYKNIIPLLQEYFFGDYGKIGLVLGAGFIKKMKQDSVFANFEHLDYSQFEEKESYEIINHKGNPENFGDAIKLLMNQ